MRYSTPLISGSCKDATWSMTVPTNKMVLSLRSLKAINFWAWHHVLLMAGMFAGSGLVNLPEPNSRKRPFGPFNRGERYDWPKTRLTHWGSIHPEYTQNYIGSSTKLPTSETPGRNRCQRLPSCWQLYANNSRNSLCFQILADSPIYGCVKIKKWKRKTLADTFILTCKQLLSRLHPIITTVRWFLELPINKLTNSMSYFEDNQAFKNSIYV